MRSRSLSLRKRGRHPCLAVLIAVSFWIWSPLLVAGQEGVARPVASAEEPGTKSTAEGAPVQVEQVTDAERITKLRRLIEENETLVHELQQKIEAPDSEYAESESEFKALDDKLEAAKKKLQQAKDAGQDQEAKDLQTEITDLEKQRKLARDRFDLAIQEHKTIQEQIATLRQKSQQDREALQKLLAPPDTRPAEQAAAPTTTGPATAPETPVAAGTGQAAETAPPTEKTQPPSEEAEPAEPPSEELLQAKEELKAKEAKAQKEEEEVRSITERISELEKTIEAQKKLVETARMQRTNAQETERSLNEQQQRLSAEGAPQEQLQELRAKIKETRERQQEAQREVTKQIDQLDSMQEQLAQLQAEQITALKEATESRAEAEESKEKVAQIENPFSPQNLLLWAVTKGPKLLAIIVGVFGLLWLAGFLRNRIVALISRRTERGSPVEREKRAKTLADVFHNTIRIIIVAVGVLMVLDVFKIPIGPLLGGAAVIGLAVAFGAQNLIRDYFTGFIILLENQYGINDVVKIAGIGGVVERITLRVTVLRDLEGVAHFVPNGQITTVSNMTHGWSRSLFDIGVAYKEDVDHVMQVLMDLAKEARSDADLGPLILDDPEMLGVDSFDDSAVVIRFRIKTKPLEQWKVKRAMLRRIKNKFDELGIEIPFPHRTVYHRTEDAEDSGAPPRPSSTS